MKFIIKYDFFFSKFIPEIIQGVEALLKIHRLQRGNLGHAQPLLYHLCRVSLVTRLWIKRKKTVQLLFHLWVAKYFALNIFCLCCSKILQGHKSTLQWFLDVCLIFCSQRYQSLSDYRHLSLKRAGKNIIVFVNVCCVNILY